MWDRDKWQEIYMVLSKNKLRTALTAFGVSWGIFMLLVMMGAGSGLRNGVTQDMGDMATNSMFLWTKRTTVPYKGFPPGRWFSFNNEDTKAIRDKIPEVQYLAPRNQLGGYRGGNNVIRGLKSGAFSIYGEVPDFFKIQPVKIQEGRLINDLDIKNERKVAVITQGVYQALYTSGENPIGSRMQINGVYFTVVGWLKPPRKSGNNQEADQSIYVPFTSFQRAFNYGDRVGWYAISSVSEVPVSEMETKVLALLAQRHTIAPDDERAFGHWNMEKEYKKISGLFMGIDALIWLVGLGTLLAGVIGISNIMLVVVKERTKEIGIKRALGATPFSIKQQIISEALIITLFAGMLGMLAGIGVVEGLASLIENGGSEMFANPEVNLSLALKALLLLLFSGVLAGLLPAQRAINIKPIDALRTD